MVGEDGSSSLYVGFILVKLVKEKPHGNGYEMA